LERVIQVIEEENPDLICLQEVDRNVRRSHYHDQPGLLADYFRSAVHFYQMNVHLKQGGYGNLVLSRWPCTQKHHLSLRHKERKPRGAQLVVVETPEGMLHLVNWHLGLGAKERQWQARHLLGHALFRQSDHLPTLIVGDCNDWRNRLADGSFSSHRFRQVTTPPSQFRSFPAFLAVTSLDKAFYRGEIHVRHARLVRSVLAKRASDHLPLVIDFHLNGHLPPAD
jgi:endonuclease/exonuclease/phosphatase family metal-dependent hydrolase